MLYRVLLTTAAAFLLAGSVLAQPTEVIPTTVDGIVPGTGISYTITATGTAREIWAPGTSDMGTWEWLNGFPEFVDVGVQTLTVDFSAPVPANRIVLGVNSISSDPFTLTVSGGTASTTDFDVADGLAAVGGVAPAAYDGATGVFSISGADQSLMVGSTSTATLTQLSITGDGSGDGYTLFFGPTNPPISVTAVPTMGEWGIGLLALMLGAAALVTLRRTSSG